MGRIDVRRRRVVWAIAVAMVLAAAVFGGASVTLGLSRGGSDIDDQGGADLVVVPEGSAAGYESPVLRAEPSGHYLPADVTGEVSAIEGVTGVASQFYLGSYAADCCASPVEVIGLDPDADFTVLSRVAEVGAVSLEEGGLVVGSKVKVEDDGTVKLFGASVPVAGRLESTGTGVDQSAFGTLTTLAALKQAAIESGTELPGDASRPVSAVLVRLSPGADAHEVGQAIEAAVDGARVIEPA